MASVHRKRGSKFWHGAFTLPDKSRRLRSTKTTDKSKAIQIALGWERATRMRATADQAQAVLADIVKAVSGDDFESVTLHKYAAMWLERRAKEVSDGTIAKYKLVIRDLKAAIPAHVSMAHVTIRTLVEIRDAIANRTSIRTANQAAKTIKDFWKSAFHDGVLAENIALKLTPLSSKREREESPERRPFKIHEVEKILDTLDPKEEWYGMVLLGTYSGQRLGDVAKAHNSQIRDGIWTFKSQKIGLEMRVALAMPVLRWIKEHGPDDGFLFPKNAATTKSGTLSNRFYSIMHKAKLVPVRPHQAKKTNALGRGARRQLCELGFHCFRHTTQTWLMESGASRELAMAHVGHEDEKTSRGYTHIGVDALRLVVEKMPVIRTEKLGQR